MAAQVFRFVSRKEQLDSRGHRNYQRWMLDVVLPFLTPSTDDSAPPDSSEARRTRAAEHHELRPRSDGADRL